MKYVIFLKNSEGRIQIIGNHDGQAFTSKNMANWWWQKYRDKYPQLEVLVIPVSALNRFPHWISYE